MTELIPLEVVVIDNHLAIDPLPGIFNSFISPRLEQTGFKVTFKHHNEEDIYDPDFSPREDSLIYVHGNKLQKYDNFERVIEISRERTDLRFIVEFDPNNERGSFDSPESYARYRSIPRLGKLSDPEEVIRVMEEKILAHASQWADLFGTQDKQTYLDQYLTLLRQQRSA